MILAVQMQHAMNQEMGEVLGEALALGSRFPSQLAEREDDLAAHAPASGLEGEHVGRLVAPAMAGIETLHPTVVRQYDGVDDNVGDGTLGNPDGAENPLLQTWHEPPPAPVFDDDVRG